jgi:hypothetical protein
MKRWRCTECSAVHTVRPQAFCSRFLSPWYLILTSLLVKQLHQRWLSLTSRQRQQYWMRGYLKQRQIAGGLVGVEQLHDAGLIVATHSLTERVVHSFQWPAYLSFAATGGPGHG